jgi:hypothetical protein
MLCSVAQAHLRFLVGQISSYIQEVALGVNKLLTITAIAEGTTGLTLVIAPSLFTSFVLGSPLIEPPSMMAARLAGTALFTLAMICWFYRNAPHPVVGITQALLFYNMSASVLLVYGLTAGLAGYGTWPAILAHIFLATWCIYAVRKGQK